LAATFDALEKARGRSMLRRYNGSSG